MVYMKWPSLFLDTDKEWRWLYLNMLYVLDFRLHMITFEWREKSKMVFGT